jgi:SAM-dependent methyltransferase
MNAICPPALDSVQEQINGRLYRHANLVRNDAVVKLHPPEAVALVRYRDDIEHCRVLDLGCGAGRLANYFRPLVGEYVGLDISERRVAYSQKLFPELTFLQGDMRHLLRFEDESFDAVFAVSNLLDAVAHAERLQVLSQVRRILTPRGLLVFSAHNRNYRHAGTGPRLSFHRNPVTQLRLLADFGQACLNHRRIKPLHRSEPGYALLNDSGNSFQTLHYYIRRDTQIRQLAESGFETQECLDTRGLTLGADEPDDANPSLMYIARRD